MDKGKFQDSLIFFLIHFIIRFSELVHFISPF